MPPLVSRKNAPVEKNRVAEFEKMAEIEPDIFFGNQSLPQAFEKVFPDECGETEDGKGRDESLRLFCRRASQRKCR